MTRTRILIALLVVVCVGAGFFLYSKYNEDRIEVLAPGQKMGNLRGVSGGPG
ncbi:MAG: hypothetical protein ABUL49_01515 [bacterium]